MFQLKEYQQIALDKLTRYFRFCRQYNGEVDFSFHKITQESFERPLPYVPVPGLTDMPYICLRLPTGGGKTLVAAHAISITKNELLQADHPLVLWLAPSNTIRDQTIRALQNRNHPYRQAIESTAGPTNVLSLSEALYLQPSVLNSGVTIIVATMQAFRVSDTEGRKVYETSGALMSHFSGLIDEQKAGMEMLDGQSKFSLANILCLRRPIVIVDEAHNVRTELSFETLARFHPACILEFTATPHTGENPSNVLYSVSAAALKAENMIKMPIRLKVHGQWRELLSDAIETRARLETAAKIEQSKTGEYIRPIMLLQAQPRNQNKPTLNVDVIRQALIDDFHIPEDQIARVTSEIDEVGDQDLSLPGSIRYIITVQALREGWDCPFAYVLYTVAASHSDRAVEQILGRVLRMPKAARKQHELLNLAYTFAASEDFGQIANNLMDALIQNGFERQDAAKMLQAVQVNQPELPLFDNRRPLSTPVNISLSSAPSLDLLPPETRSKINFDPTSYTLSVSSVLDSEEVRMLRDSVNSEEEKQALDAVVSTLVQEPGQEVVLSPSERGEVFSLPHLSIRRGQQLSLFEETDLLSIPWHLSGCDFQLTEQEYTPGHLPGRVVDIDISEQGKLHKNFVEDLQNSMRLFSTDMGWSIAELVDWLDRTISHPTINRKESAPFINRLVLYLVNDRQIPLERLAFDKYRLRDKVADKIEYHKKEARKKAYNQLQLLDCETPLVVSPEICFTFPQYAYPYSFRYRGGDLVKHYYPEIGDLNGEELKCAYHLDRLEEVEYWVRNLPGHPNSSFWLQTSTDRFYPDFVCKLKDGRYLVVEYKGEDRRSNDDSREKNSLGELWMLRSGGTCLFIMTNGLDLNAIDTLIRKKQ